MIYFVNIVKYFVWPWFGLAHQYYHCFKWCEQLSTPKMKSLSDNALTKCTLSFSMTVCISAVNFLYIAKYDLWSDLMCFICPCWIYDWRQNKPWANLKPNCHFASDSRSWNRAVPERRRSDTNSWIHWWTHFLVPLSIFWYFKVLLRSLSYC